MCEVQARSGYRRSCSGLVRNIAALASTGPLNFKKYSLSFLAAGLFVIFLERAFEDDSLFALC